ncbi:hypothetical protein CYMTET_45882, partial [Cymbomonas tetramitiformis]|eukprot:gene17208-20470_t
MPIHELSQELVDEISKGYKSLAFLNLSNNRISRIENLAPLGRLTKLDLSRNDIEIVDNLECLPLLRELNLQRNRIKSLSSYSWGLPLLELLNLGDNFIGDIHQVRALSHLPALKKLILEGNPIATLSSYRAAVACQLSELGWLDEDPLKASTPKAEDTEAVTQRLQASGNRTTSSAPIIDNARPTHPHTQTLDPAPLGHPVANGSKPEIPGGHARAQQVCHMLDGYPETPPFPTALLVEVAGLPGMDAQARPQDGPDAKRAPKRALFTSSEVCSLKEVAITQVSAVPVASPVLPVAASTAELERSFSDADLAASAGLPAQGQLRVSQALGFPSLMRPAEMANAPPQHLQALQHDTLPSFHPSAPPTSGLQPSAFVPQPPYAWHPSPPPSLLAVLNQ